MPNCDFYGQGNDFRELLDFIFSQPGWVLHQLASDFDRPVIVYSTANAVFDHCAVGTRSIHFKLYAPDMGGVVVHSRVQLAPGAVAGATHRFTAEGWGLVQLYLGSERQDGITPSHTNHYSPERARTWSATPSTGALGDPSLWDWRAVSRVSSRGTDS